MNLKEKIKNHSIFIPIILSIIFQSTTAYELDSKGWLKIDTTIDNDWPQIPNNDETFNFYLYDSSFENNEDLQLNQKYLKTEEDFVSNFEIKFNYWTNKDFSPSCIDKKKCLEEEQNFFKHKKSFQETDKKLLTFDEWKNFLIDSNDKRILFKDVQVEFKRKIDLPFHHGESENFQKKTENFIENKDSESFNYIKDSGPARLQYIINDNEDFEKTCISITPSENDDLSDFLNITLTFEHESFAIELPNDIDFYNEKIVDEKKGFCLGKYFAIRPNGRTMIAIDVMQSYKDDIAVNFNKIEQNDLKSFKTIVTPENTIDNKNWIYNHKFFDYKITLKDQNLKPEKKIFACDIMANCFKYHYNSDLNKLELEEFGEKVLDKSPIIRIFTLTQDLPNEKTAKIIDVLNKIKDAIELKNDKDLKIIVKNLPGKNEPILIIKNVNSSISIPYIDLRAYKAKLKGLNFKNCDLSIGNGSKFTIDYDQKNGICFGNFFKPRTSDLFENYWLKFEFDPVIDEKNLRLLVLHFKSNAPSSIDDEPEKKDFQGFTDWQYENVQYGSDGKMDLKLAIKPKPPVDFCKVSQFYIIFYDGTIENIAPNSCKDSENSQAKEITFQNVPIRGPYRIFYSFKSGEATVTSKLTGQQPKFIKPSSPRYFWYGDKQGKEGRDFPLSGIDDCPVDFAFNANMTRCLLQTIYQHSIINCENGCSNIFNKNLLKINLFRNEDDGLIYNTDKEIDGETFYIPNQNFNDNHLKIIQNENNDICATFNYFGNGEKLYINTSDSKEMWFYPTNTDETFEDPICMSHFTTDFSKNYLSLWFENENIDNDFQLKYISDIGIKSQKFSAIKSLNLNELNAADFIYQDDLITIEGNSIYIDASRQKYMVKNDEDFEAQLRSRFIELNNHFQGDSYKIDLGFMETFGNWIDHGDIIIEFNPESKSMGQYSVKDLKKHQINSLIYEKSDKNIENFQLILRFMIKNTTKNYLKLNYTIEQIILNDPCVNENLEANYCFENDDRGTCRRYFAPQPVGHCECRFWAFGEKCETVDYCLRLQGHDYCRSNDYGLCESSSNDFKCQCSKGVNWIPSIRGCISPTNKTCKPNEHFGLDKERRPICLCNENFVRINDECVEYDVCNSTHRYFKGHIPKEPCEDKLAKCEKSTDDENNGYRCVCPSDLYNVDGEFGRKAQCRDRLCELDLNCQQNCSFNEKNGKSKCGCFTKYALDSNTGRCEIQKEFENQLQECLPKNSDELKEMEKPYVDVNGNCLCKFGFHYNQETKKCESNDNDEIHKKMGCENFEYDENGKFICNCQHGKHFDNHYGKCRWDSCPERMIKYSKDMNNINDFECISPCDTRLIKSCSSIGNPFVNCKPENVIESLIVLNSIYDWNIDEPFVEGKHHKTTSIDNYCDCINGFNYNEQDENCEPDASNNYFTIKIEFLRVYNRKTTENFFRDILKELLAKTSIKLDKTSCIENENGTFDCKANVWIPKKDVMTVSSENPSKEKIIKLLSEHCINYSYLFDNGDKNLCTFMKKNPYNSIRSTLIKRNDSMITFNLYDFCESTPCKFFPNSYCNSINDGTDFECNCGKDFKRNEYYPTPSKKYSACALKTCEDLGYKCEDSSALCIMINDNNAQNIESKLNAKLFDESLFIEKTFTEGTLPMPICKCNNGYLLSNLSSTCDDKCSKQCNNGTCYFTMYEKREICSCHDGWIGDDCKIKKSDLHKDDDHDKKANDDDQTNGYKISTIILAIVAAVLVIAVLFLFIRSRN